MKLVVLFLVAVYATVEAVKMTPQMEKCGEQLLMALAKESDKAMKTLMNNLIKSVQKGDVKKSQELAKTMSEAQSAYATEHYWIKDCATMKGCLECPVEL